MKSIGIVSDSHHNLNNLQKALNYLINDRKIDMLFHLGDFYEDLDNIEILKNDLQIFKVPGTENYLYNSKMILKRLKIKIDDIVFLLSHVPRKHQCDPIDDNEIEDAINTKSIKSLIYGHTHQYRIFYDNNSSILYINPGHLKDVDKQNTPPTFANMIIDKNRVIVKIYNLLNKIMLKKRYIL